MSEKATYTRHVELSADEMSNLAAWDRAVVRAWKDQEFKQRLIDDPHAALNEMGFQPPKGVRLVIVENTPDRRHLVLPAPASGDVSVEELDRSPLHDYDAGF
jgi:hypothetical protein